MGCFAFVAAAVPNHMQVARLVVAAAAAQAVVVVVAEGVSALHLGLHKDLALVLQANHQNLAALLD